MQHHQVKGREFWAEACSKETWMWSWRIGRIRAWNDINILLHIIFSLGPKCGTRISQILRSARFQGSSEDKDIKVKDKKDKEYKEKDNEVKDNKDKDNKVKHNKVKD